MKLGCRLQNEFAFKVCCVIVLKYRFTQTERDS